MIRLAPIADEHRAGFAEMLDEYRAHGETGLYTGFYAAAWDGFDAYRAMLARLRAGGWPWPEVVPGETLFVMCEQHIVGEVYLRFGLTSALEENGGNIGYQIRPAERNTGYATHALRLALTRLRERGIERALITCDPGNAASIRVIEKCGGRRVDDSVSQRRYVASTDPRDALLAELRAYVAADDRERAMRDRIVELVERHPDAFERALTVGHITASAWIVDRSRTHALLLHHRKLDRWLQPGGHADGDADLRRAALREATEESGLTSLQLASPRIYDVDVHAIPARAGEPAHEHFDVRFAFEADEREPLAANAESHALAWVPLDALDGYAVDESVVRLARKTPALPKRR